MTGVLTSGDKQKFTRRLKEARIGDPQAQYDIALMYANGAGVAKSQGQAFSWTKAAAEKGHVPAQFLLGCAFAGGLGIEKDDAAALLWFTKAHEAGHAKATMRLAKLLNARGPHLAFRLAQEAETAGLVEATCFVAECLATGHGTVPDVGSARLLYMKAAEGGHAQAQFVVGRHFSSKAESTSALEQARHWMRKAAAQGHPGARLALEELDDSEGGRVAVAGARPRQGSRDRRLSEGRWIKYVQQGQAQDAYDLGEMFLSGIGVEKSTKQARAWFRRAAEQGLAAAQFVLAQQLESSDSSMAAHWYQLAAGQGHVDAQTALAVMYQNGTGVAKDPLEAFAWYSRAAQLGSADAIYALALQSSKPSDFTFRQLMERAAFKGHSGAQFELGELYAQGTGVAQNWFDACRWYQLSADQGHGMAQAKLAGCYTRGTGVPLDLAMAFAWYERAAAQNIPIAQWSLGELYAQGVKGVAPDVKKAATLCKRAANAGFAPARATLGALFAKSGQYERAVHWWALAADQGDVEAIYNLAQAYRLGKGVSVDADKAFELYLRAGNAGLGVAQSRLGLAYATGEGVALDATESCKWFELAAARGDAAATANLVKARAMLSPAQAREVARRVQAWVPVKYAG